MPVVLGILALAVMSVTGCATGSNIILVPLGDPVILLADTPTTAKVLVRGSDGEWVEGELDYIPSGFACLAPENTDFE